MKSNQGRNFILPFHEVDCRVSVIVVLEGDRITRPYDACGGDGTPYV